LREVLVGSPESNPFIRPGDIISIPETDQIFVTGAVVKPGATPLRSRLTLIQALGIAGGFAPDARPEPYSNRTAGSGLENPPGDLSTMLMISSGARRRTSSCYPNDVIHVPSSLPKSMGRGTLGVSVNLLSTIPFLITC
jgi:polysaccharide export outer membrane protein